MLSGAIDKQKKTLFSGPVAEESRSLIGVLWEYFVILMVTYFVYSIINSLVQNYLQEEADGKQHHKESVKKEKK